MARRRLGFIDTRSIGSAIWELTHPDQVQQEYEAVGKTPPSYPEIWDAAINDAIVASREGVSNAAESVQNAAGELVEGATNIGKFALIAGGIVLAIYLLERNSPRHWRDDDED